MKKQTTGPSTAALLAVVAAFVAVVLGVVAIGAALFDPFATQTIDRSGPALLERIRELEEFTAAEGNFVEDVDLEQDAKYLPDFLKGQRVTALGDGQRARHRRLLPARRRRGRGGRTTARRSPSPCPSPCWRTRRSTRPAPRSSAATAGLLDRIGEVLSANPFDDRELYVAAEEKLNTAAAQSDLQQTAKANTEAWLETFLGAAGFEDITINWSSSPT